MNSTILNRGIVRIRFMTLTSTLAIALLAGTGAVTTAAAADTDDFKQEISRTWNEIKDFSADKKDAAVKKSQEILNDIDAKLDELSAEAKDASKDAKAETKEKWQASMSRLHELRDTAAARLGDLKDSSADAWDDAKHGFGSAVEKLGDGIEDAGEAIKK